MRIAHALLLLVASVALPAAAQTASQTAVQTAVPAEQAQAALQPGEPATASPPAATPAQAMPTKSQDEVKRQIEAEYGVTVLRMRDLMRDDDTPAYAVTVMNRGGDRNDALAVSTVEVDARTGTLIPQFRHTADGYQLPQGGSYEPNRSTTNPAVLRGDTWR